jgi:hypothetical protein
MTNKKPGKKTEKQYGQEAKLSMIGGCKKRTVKFFVKLRR